MNYKKIIIYISINIHILGIISFLLYGLKTNSVCNFIITSEQEIEISAKTPLDKNISYNLSPGDTLYTSMRPWKEITVSYNDVRHNININQNNKTNSFIKHAVFYYRIEHEDNSKFIGTYSFINNLFPWLLPSYFSFILLFLLYLFLIRNNKLIALKHIKIKLFRYLLKGQIQGKRSKSIHFNKLQKIWMLILSLFILISLYTSLGKYPYGQEAEEKRRALVSLEMKISENYIVPTTNGEKYYNKPPLFNWLLLPVIDTENVELKTRAISTSILILLCLTIFLLLRKSRGWHNALFVSIGFICSWHVLSYLSFMTNVDNLFALFLVPLFYLNFRYSSKNKPLQLFIIGYTLFALAFLTKGIPAIWFFVVSLLLSLYINKRLRLLFTWQHLIGIASAVLILGSYIAAYSLQTEPLPYIKQLLNETQIGDQFTLLEKMKYILSFPAINIKAYRPLLILLPCILFKNNIIALLKSKEQSYLLLLTLIGSLIFLSSPLYNPYYILMFIPIISDLIVRALNQINYDTFTNRVKLPIILILVFIPYVMFYEKGNFWSILVYIAIALFIVFFNKQTTYILLTLFTIVVSIRAFGDMGYYTENFDFNTPTKEDCRRVIKNNSQDIAIIKDGDLINYVSVFYLTYYSNQIIPLVNSIDNDTYNYLTTKPELYVNHQSIDSIQQYVWVYDPQLESKGKSVYKPLYLITNKQSK